jgi:hypothetical protein
VNYADTRKIVPGEEGFEMSRITEGCERQAYDLVRGRGPTRFDHEDGRAGRS